MENPKVDEVRENLLEQLKNPNLSRMEILKIREKLDLLDTQE